MFEETVGTPLSPRWIARATEEGVLNGARKLAFLEEVGLPLPPGLQVTPEEVCTAVELLRLAQRYFRLKEELADLPVLIGRRQEEWLETQGLADLVHELCDLADTPAQFAKGFTIENTLERTEEFTEGIVRDTEILRRVARGKPQWRFCRNLRCLDPFKVPDDEPEDSNPKEYCSRECSDRARKLRAYHKKQEQKLAEKPKQSRHPCRNPDCNELSAQEYCSKDCEDVHEWSRARGRPGA